MWDVPYESSALAGSLRGLEQLYSFGWALLPRLSLDRDAVHIAGDVELEYYRLQQLSSGVIYLGCDDVSVAEGLQKRELRSCRVSLGCAWGWGAVSAIVT